tara:strand:+ start:13330 stop:13527 length:198 start_codon:yes stop_codon:yes gene_type:complete
MTILISSGLADAGLGIALVDTNLETKTLPTISIYAKAANQCTRPKQTRESIAESDRARQGTGRGS